MNRSAVFSNGVSTFRRVTFSLALMALFQGNALAAAESEVEGPDVKVDNAVVDLGIKPYDQPLSHSFSVSNTGKSPHTLTLSRKDCGCTTSVVSEMKLNPGDVQPVEIGFAPKNPPRASGKRDFTVSFDTDDPACPQITLKLIVRLVKPVEASAEELNLGDVDDGDDRGHILEIECFSNNGAQPKILSVGASEPCLSVVPIGEAVTEWGTSHKFSVSVDMANRYIFVGAIAVSTDSGVVPLLEVPVRATRTSPLGASPARILYGVVHTGEAKTLSVTLSANQPGIVPVGALSSDPRVIAELESVPSDGNWRLSATLKASDSADKVKGTITIVGENKVSLLEIPVFGVIASSGK